MNKRLFRILLVILITILCVVIFLLLNKKDIDNDIIIVNDAQYNSELFDCSSYCKYEDEYYTSMAGIDISEHNKFIEFKDVKESGIDFVFIRAAWRGYTEGKLHDDYYFKFNYEEAKENGLLVGVYLFSQAINEKEAIEEANHLLKLLDHRPLDLPVVYDFEYIDTDEARTDGITKEQCTKNALAFFHVIQEEYDVALYANSVLLKDYYDMDELSKYPLWYAQYYNKPTCDYDFFIWQYDDEGVVSGIEEKTDLNIMFIPKENDN